MDQEQQRRARVAPVEIVEPEPLGEVNPGGGFEIVVGRR
jgi:hypothetical protein